MPLCGGRWPFCIMVKPARAHTRFEKARIIGARALQISMGAPLFVSEDELREEFSGELIQLYGVDEAKERVVLDPMKIATLEYLKHRIPIDAVSYTHLTLPTT